MVEGVDGKIPAKIAMGQLFKTIQPALAVGLLVRHRYQPQRYPAYRDMASKAEASLVQIENQSIHHVRHQNVHAVHG